ncbi:MAG: serine--tRNA ligase [Bacteroidetes bacterium]|nr:MAG: serine--tRNA ligase [Bacteroidota bacterium]
MLTLNQIKNNPEELIKKLSVRNKDFSQLIHDAIKTDNKRKEIQSSLDATLEQSNKIAKSIGQLFKEGKQAEAGKAKSEAAELKEKAKELTAKLNDAKAELQTILFEIPNIPHPSVPAGKTDADNAEIRAGGTIPKLSKKVPHWELADTYDLIDFELGNKITGAGFPVYKGKGAKLQRALIAFFLDEADKAGFTEIMPPLVINEASGFGTGQLPDKEGQMYQVTEDKLFLIPTAEVPVTNLYRDVILKEDDFPIKMTAYSSCFRREAGSYGKDVRGLNRLHQFDKVEIVQIQHPDKSYETLDEMVAYVESLVQKLELPYRIVRLCGGDLGFTSALTYDFEVYSAGQDKWLEVSSVSNFETFQANRLKLRFKKVGEKQTQPAHTLNGSALALPRIVAALLENNYTEEGIKIPEVLQKFTNFDLIN